MTGEWAKNKGIVEANVAFDVAFDVAFLKEMARRWATQRCLKELNRKGHVSHQVLPCIHPS